MDEKQDYIDTSYCILMGTGSVSVRSRGEGPNLVEFKSRFHQKNYLRIMDPLHSPSLLPLKNRNFFFFKFHTRASHLRRIFVSSTAIHLVLNI